MVESQSNQTDIAAAARDGAGSGQDTGRRDTGGSGQDPGERQEEAWRPGSDNGFALLQASAELAEAERHPSTVGCRGNNCQRVGTMRDVAGPEWRELTATGAGGASTSTPGSSADEQPKRGNAGAADSPPPQPVEVLGRRVKGHGHQYECKLEGGGKAWLPGKLLKERYPVLLAAFNSVNSGEEKEDETPSWWDPRAPPYPRSFIKTLGIAKQQPPQLFDPAGMTFAEARGVFNEQKLFDKSSWDSSTYKGAELSNLIAAYKRYFNGGDFAGGRWLPPNECGVGSSAAAASAAAAAETIASHLSHSPSDPALWENTPAFTVVVVGDIHEGKSQLVDAMLDPAVDQPRPDILELGGLNANADGTTKGCTSYVSKVIEGRRIKIFDLPGISYGILAEDEEAQDAGAPADSNKAAAVAAGAGGLVALLQSTFRRRSINLVLVVHPSNETAIKLGGQVLRLLIELGLMAGDKAEASKNIKIVFTKADLLEPPKVDEDEKQIQRNVLESKVLKDYFEGLGGSDEGAEEDAEPKHCFTYGEPWNDDASWEEKTQRPAMKTVDTHELDALIGQVIRARPDFEYSLKLPPGAEVVHRDLGLAQLFGSKASIESWGKGYKAQMARLADLEQNNLLPTGLLNCHEERRRIAIHLATAAGAWADELRKRVEFLHLRTTKKIGGPKGESRMTLAELEDEFIERGHIGPRPAFGERYPHKGSFKALCPPCGKRGDIAWALYQNATMAEDGFDGSERVPFVADEDAPATVSLWGLLRDDVDEALDALETEVARRQQAEPGWQLTKKHEMSSPWVAGERWLTAGIWVAERRSDGQRSLPARAKMTERQRQRLDALPYGEISPTDATLDALEAEVARQRQVKPGWRMPANHEMPWGDSTWKAGSWASVRRSDGDRAQALRAKMTEGQRQRLDALPYGEISTFSTDDALAALQAEVARQRQAKPGWRLTSRHTMVAPWGDQEWKAGSWLKNRSGDRSQSKAMRAKMTLRQLQRLDALPYGGATAKQASMAPASLSLAPPSLSLAPPSLAAGRPAVTIGGQLRIFAAEAAPALAGSGGSGGDSEMPKITNPDGQPCCYDGRLEASVWYFYPVDAQGKLIQDGEERDRWYRAAAGRVWFAGDPNKTTGDYRKWKKSMEKLFGGRALKYFPGYMKTSLPPVTRFNAGAAQIVATSASAFASPSGSPLPTEEDAASQGMPQPEQPEQPAPPRPDPLAEEEEDGEEPIGMLVDDPTPEMGSSDGAGPGGAEGRGLKRTWEEAGISRLSELMQIENAPDLAEPRLISDGGHAAKDEARAVDLYTPAADQGDAVAQCNLDDMYAQGRGVPRDEARAVDLYTQAADQGNARAQCLLGDMYAPQPLLPAPQPPAAAEPPPPAPQPLLPAPQPPAAAEPPPPAPQPLLPAPQPPAAAEPPPLAPQPLLPAPQPLLPAPQPLQPVPQPPPALQPLLPAPQPLLPSPQPLLPAPQPPPAPQPLLPAPQPLLPAPQQPPPAPQPSAAAYCGGGGAAASGEGGRKRPLEAADKPHHILNPVNLRLNAPYITKGSQLPFHLAVLKQMMTAAESELPQSEDWPRNCADQEPRCWAVWLLRAVEEVKAVSDNKRRKALSDGVAQGGGYTRFAATRHADAVRAYNQRLPPGASPLTAIESLVHAIDAIDLGLKNSPNLDCSCKLLGGVAASCELLELEVNDRSALEERFEDKVGAEAKLVLALRQICLVALCVARAFFPEYEENDVRNAALVLIRHVCFGSEPAGTEARRACLADLLRLADLPAEAVNGFDVCLTKETNTSSGGKATISGKKRADICIFVKEASAVESVGQGTAAGTSRASVKAPKKTCPKPGCGFRVPNRQMGRCPGPGCTHEWVPKAKQP